MIPSVGVNSRQSTTEIEELLKKEALLKDENKKLLEKVQYLSDQLEYRNLKGDFDPRQTKILHLKYSFNLFFFFISRFSS